MVVQKFQSTLPRRERRHRPDVVGITLDISIHAPAKGATKAVLYYLILLGYFNPRSREGSDVVLVWLWCVLLYFNPRSREGSDVVLVWLWCVIVFQSTLPRRERPIHVPAIVWLYYFNPRSREGSDSSSVTFGFAFSYFNPRSREGSDYRAGQEPRTRIHFNPRSREGSDPNTVLVCSFPRLFQSTLPRRERRFGEVSKPYRLNRFQSTLPRRERLTVG